MKQMSQLGKMFTYVALCQLRNSTNKKFALASVNDFDLEDVLELGKLGAVAIDMTNNTMLITKNGGKLVRRYFAACADELRDGHFGKFTWSKRSKFHKALMQRIA